MQTRNWFCYLIFRSHNSTFLSEATDIVACAAVAFEYCKSDCDLQS